MFLNVYIRICYKMSCFWSMTRKILGKKLEPATPCFHHTLGNFNCKSTWLQKTFMHNHRKIKCSLQDGDERILQSPHISVKQMKGLCIELFVLSWQDVMRHSRLMQNSCPFFPYPREIETFEFFSYLSARHPFFILTNTLAKNHLLSSIEVITKRKPLSVSFFLCGKLDINVLMNLMSLTASLLSPMS